jgi:hypothetical protein
MTIYFEVDDFLRQFEFLQQDYPDESVPGFPATALDKAASGAPLRDAFGQT